MEKKDNSYTGKAKELLDLFKVEVWDKVLLEVEGAKFIGIILPRQKTLDQKHIALKLDNGYNVGIALEKIKNIKKLGQKVANYKIPESFFPKDPKKPNIMLLGTGGTIASRLDYKTGAVIPAFSPGELYGAVPELADIANLTTKKLFGIFSEDMGPKQYIPLAKEIKNCIEEGYDGIIIGHGTDTLHHTASILSFMVQDSPIPIVLVGSQRSSDRPSSDAALNLMNAVYSAAYSDIAEIMVCMYGPTSDKFDLLHRGTRVRKMHSSYRSTFRTIGERPIAAVRVNEIIYLVKDYKKRRKDKKAKIFPCFEEKVTLLYYYPNMQPDIIEAIYEKGYKGLIIAGTGLGHVNRALFPVLEKVIKGGMQIYMTVQTLWGYVHMNVYDTGRYLLDLGVIPCENMLPEVAYVKLCWALGQTEDREKVKEIMLKPIAGEMTEREPYDGYIILQGGIPEVDEFLKNHLI